MNNLSKLEILVLEHIPPSEADVLGRTIPVSRYFDRIKLALEPNVSVKELQAALDSLIQKDYLIQINDNLYGRTNRPAPNLEQ